MATGTHTGTNYAIANAPTPSTLLDSSKWGGKVRVMNETILTGAAGDAGSIIKIGKLPKGAMPLMTVVKTNCTTAATLAIGSSANTDLLGACSSLTATATQILVPTVTNTPLTADTEIEALTAAAAVAAVTLDVAVYYSVE